MFLNVELPQPKAPQISKTFCRSSLGSQPSSSSSVSHLCGVFLSAVRVPRLCQVTLGAGAARGVWSPVPTICVRWCMLVPHNVWALYTPEHRVGVPRRCLPGPARCPGSSLHLIHLDTLFNLTDTCLGSNKCLAINSHKPAQSKNSPHLLTSTGVSFLPTGTWVSLGSKTCSVILWDNKTLEKKKCTSESCGNTWLHTSGHCRCPLCWASHWRLCSCSRSLVVCGWKVG